jgi:hypothetical protein
MNRELLIREIEHLVESTKGPFPYDDIRKMKRSERLAPHFRAMGDEEDLLESDLNTYFMCIAGIGSRFLQGSEGGTPKEAIQWLALGDFFTIFPKYRFLEGEWEAFPQFSHEYVSMRRMREIELELLLTNDELLALKKHNPVQGWNHFLGPMTVIVIDDSDDDLDDENTEVV